MQSGAIPDTDAFVLSCHSGGRDNPTRVNHDGCSNACAIALQGEIPSLVDELSMGSEKMTPTDHLSAHAHRVPVEDNLVLPGFSAS